MMFATRYKILIGLFLYRGDFAARYPRDFAAS